MTDFSVQCPGCGARAWEYAGPHALASYQCAYCGLAKPGSGRAPVLIDVTTFGDTKQQYVPALPAFPPNRIVR